MARKAKIIVHTGRESPEPPAIAHLLLLLSGVCALLLPTINGLEYSTPRTLLLAVSLCVFLWTVARIGWRWAVFCSMLCAVFWCVACILMQEELSVQLTGAARLVLSASPDPEPVPFGLAASLYAVLIVLLFFSSELLIGSHVLPYSLTMIVFLLGPLLGVHPSIEAAAFALMFQFCYWAMNGSGMRQSRFDFALPSRARLTALMGAAMSLILAAVLLIAVPLAARNDERLYFPAYAAEGALRRGVSRLSGAASALVMGGNLNRGNQYPTGTTHLILTASRKPTQPVYLRGFSGSDYQYAGWDSNFETEMRIFADMAAERSAGWDVPSGEMNFLIGSLYRNFDGMYWRLNRESFAARDGAPTDIDLTVQQNNQQYLNAYTPYYGEWSGGRLGINYSFDAPVVSFYEQNDLAIDWENAHEAEDCKWMERHYQQHIQSVYTRVPSERLPRLVQLCREHPLTDPEEITAFILHTLQSRASYSLTPGWTPLNRDMVEYFLFDNGLGYCQHFASAATLMYRLYGIPARYATGYIAMPEDFLNVRAALDSSYPPSEESQSPEGTHIAVLSDVSAHAWVEIFLSGYGWTPVEVTPAADGSIAPQYPGLNLDKLAERLAEWNLVFPATLGGRTAIPSGQSLVANFAQGLNRQTRKTVTRWLDALLLCAPFLIAAAFYYRRWRRLALYAVSDCRVSYGRLLSMLRFSGVLSDCDGQEADFPARLSAAVPAIAEADATRLYRVAEIAAYGSATVPEEEHAFARNLCQRAADALYNGLNVWKRFLFRWWYLYD